MAALSNVPDDPMPLARAWLDDAAAADIHNPWAMSLATVGPHERPACRYVLLKHLDTRLGFAVFYTNYASRKAADLGRSARAAAALYWPLTGRQLRFEGRVVRSPDDESDAYFATRPRASQLNAWVSAQSRPLPDDGLEPALGQVEARFPPHATVPRPDGWGGYRIWLEAIEFWVEGTARFHERVRYERVLDGNATSGYAGRHWEHVRLQP